MSFDGLGLSPELLRAVSDEGYTEPTPVQAAAIPVILEGRDVLAGAQTGTGKTAAFVLPIIQTLHETRRDAGAARHPVRVLVVVPTRELAIQVEESCPDVRQAPADPLRHGLRRRRHRRPAHEAPRRARDRRRDARSPARPRRPAHDRPVDGRGPRARRGRPPARHGLHPGHPEDHRPAPEAAPEPAVLGDVHRRRPPARGRHPARPGARPGHAPQHDHGAHRPARDPGRPRAQARPRA